MKKIIISSLFALCGCGNKVNLPISDNKEEETFVHVPHEANNAAEETKENNADTQVITPVPTVPNPVVTAVPNPVVTTVPNPVVTAVPNPIVTAVPNPVITAVPNPIVTATPTNAKIVYANLKGWKNEWNDFIVDGINLKENIFLLDNDKVPKEDMNTICPGFFSATNKQKQAVWALLFAAITKYESGFNPKSYYMESWGTASQGLLQLSYGDEKVSSWKPCDLDKAKDNIYDPKINLMCGISIMRAQILKRKEIFYKDNEKSYYWAVLKTKRNNIKNIIIKTAKSELKFCNL